MQYLQADYWGLKIDEDKIKKKRNVFEVRPEVNDEGLYEEGPGDTTEKASNNHAIPIVISSEILSEENWPQPK